MADDLTWRFEVKMRDHDGWVPITRYLLGADEPLYGDIVDTMEMIGIHREPADAAKDELDEALAGLAAFGQGRGMTGARIVVWDDVGAEGDPAVVLEATADQLAAGRLRVSTIDVDAAKREVEDARTRVRNEIIRAATVDRLGRNMIARNVEGAWARRLVLGFLAGHDLVEAIRDALPESLRWAAPDGYYPEPGEEYLGPYFCGPVQIDLEASGQVYLRLLNPDRPGAEENASPHRNESADPEGTAREKPARMHRLAETVLSRLTSAGIHLQTGDRSPAAEEHLVAGTRLLATEA
ncbi:hypothetical protein [Amycolatopsis sp. RTGN1]|uniref:hypothetical protein n=1 Tax=Amycolatopsis ponsaeliensis TaxID=2992142 RepID=UPI00254B8F62|nr:hypothetical protein [Amycolatopsis sp. RTGN1]